MPYGKGRWIDQNGRSHEWSGDVASTARNQIKSQIRSQTGAKKVIISSVTPNDSSSYRDFVREHQQREREERDRRAEELKNSAPANYSAPVRYSSSSSSSGSQMDLGTSMGLLVLLGGLWLFFTYTPFVLMFLYGPGSAWIAEKITGQSIEEYTEEENPTDKQHKKALAIILSAIIFGGAGFVQGSNLQRDWAAEENNQPKVEQVNKQ